MFCILNTIIISSDSLLYSWLQSVCRDGESKNRVVTRTLQVDVEVLPFVISSERVKQMWNDKKKSVVVSENCKALGNRYNLSVWRLNLLSFFLLFYDCTQMLVKHFNWRLLNCLWTLNIWIIVIPMVLEGSLKIRWFYNKRDFGDILFVWKMTTCWFFITCNLDLIFFFVFELFLVVF